MERLQILLRPDQAARLREAARAQGVPVTELVRDAIDQAVPHPRAPKRLASLAQFHALPVVAPGPDPDTLEA
jgi:class 3 adenylate cyclase